MKKYLSIFGIIWLTALVFFTWGAAMVFYDIFPSRPLKSAFTQINEFLEGQPGDYRLLRQRFGRGVKATFISNPSPFPIKLDLKSVDISSYRGPTIEFLNHAKYYSDTDREEYFLVYGSFAFEDTNWGAILISTEGRILKGWSMNPKPWEQREENGGHIGLAVSKTGDLVTNTHGVLSSYDWCGKKEWEIDVKEKRPEPDPYLSDYPSKRGAGVWCNVCTHRNYQNFHHDIIYREGRFYTFLGPEIVSVDEPTGEIMGRIHKAELYRWARAQDLAIFNRPYTTETSYYLNKVDVLSKELAESFDDFEAGDMLVSMKYPSLLFVFRPETAEILWYRYGFTSNQHDATFQRGYIAVFDNNPYANNGDPHAKPEPGPRILTLGVKERTRSILFDLKTWGVKMPYRGNFELDEDRNLLTFSDDDNGRAIVGHLPSGKPVFVFENRIEAGVLTLRNITRVSPQQVEEWSSQCN